MSWLATYFTPRKLVSTISLAGLAAGALLAYAVYVDYRRRSALDYKAKLRARRKLNSQRFAGVRPGTSLPSQQTSPHTSPMRIPPVDAAGMQHFFLQEVQLGEEMLMEGHVDEGIDHLAMAILMCNKPEQVMGVFKQTLAQGHYSLLERAVPKARTKFAQLMAYSRGDNGSDMEEESDFARAQHI